MAPRRGPHEAHARPGSASRQEREADHCAVGLWLPPPQAPEATKSSGNSLQEIETLSQTCQPAPAATATAMRHRSVCSDCHCIQSRRFGQLGLQSPPRKVCLA